MSDITPSWIKGRLIAEGIISYSVFQSIEITINENEVRIICEDEDTIAIFTKKQTLIKKFEEQLSKDIENVKIVVRLR